MEMRKIGRQISVLMGFTLSFCLSLTGNLASGKFTFVGFILSFVVSLIISLAIGFIVPMKKVGDAVDRKFGLRPMSPPAHAVEALVSDLIYTPIITLAMIAMAYKNATSHGAKNLHFLPMFAKSLLLSMIVGYVLIFIFTPIYTKLVLKKNGISGPPPGRPGPPVDGGHGIGLPPEEDK